ncbi:MAG: bacteriohopanetetrol glucosamine biosynthesis glycosyltransferase HpnI [Actinomycetota bacterium]
MVVQGAALLLALAAVAGIGFQIAAALAVNRFVVRPRPLPHVRPTFSVLKPLCGAEPHLDDNLASVTAQGYPGLQLVCGVADHADPARAVAEACGATVVVDPRRHGRNLKVGNLLNMLPQASGDILAIADSDVRVRPGWADDIAAGLEQPGVGLVTCLYVGRPAGGLWSAVGALGINHGFLPSALVARALGRTDGCFGATMALKRDVLDRIGGLQPLADLLADDWALGAAVRRLGLGIGLAPRPVDIVVDEPDLATLLAHEIRWGRTVAAVDRAGYVASVITQPVALAALSWAAGASWPFAAVLTLAALAKLAVVRAEERALELPRAGFGVLLLREALTFVVYVAAISGRSVTWRGKRFRVRPDGTLEPLEGAAQ